MGVSNNEKRMLAVMEQLADTLEDLLEVPMPKPARELAFQAWQQLCRMEGDSVVTRYDFWDGYRYALPGEEL